MTTWCFNSDSINHNEDGVDLFFLWVFMQMLILVCKCVCFLYGVPSFTDEPIFHWIPSHSKSKLFISAQTILPGPV